jgi:transcriptional regulator with XRE-family HTH domain
MEGRLVSKNSLLTDPKEAGRRLRELRQKADLTVAELAKRAGYTSKSPIEFIERGGSVPYLGSPRVIAIAQALGVPPEAFAIVPPTSNYDHSTKTLNEGGIIWPCRDLVDLRRADTELPNSYPKIDLVRLLGLQIIVPDADSPPVPGRIRVLKKKVPIPYPDGSFHARVKVFCHPVDLRDQEIPYRSRLLRSGKRAILLRTGRARDDGEWLDKEKKEIWQFPDTRLFGIAAYMARRYVTPDGKQILPTMMWHQYRRQRSGDLGRYVEWWEVDHGRAVVFSFEDGDEIVRLRTNLQARKHAGKDKGEYLYDDGSLFNHTVLGLCITDEKAAKDFGRTCHFPRYWRKHQHPALDPAVNGGRARSDWVPPLVIKYRAKPVLVTCRADLKTIIAWEERLAAAGVLIENQRLAGRSLVTGDEIGNQLTANEGTASYDLRLVLLPAFRRERPESCTRCFAWAGRKRERRTELVPQSAKARTKKGVGARGRKNVRPRYWYQRFLYAHSDFISWLRGRELASAADAARATLPRMRLPKAIAYLQFVLTHPCPDLPVGDAQDREAAEAAIKGYHRRFRQFRANLRVGQTLSPSGEGVPFRKLRELAKRIGIGQQGLRLARQWLESRGAKFEGTQKSREGWRLAGPLTIAVPLDVGPERTGEVSARTQPSPATSPNETPPRPGAVPASPASQKAAGKTDKYPGHSKKPYTTGRTPDQLRERMLEYCYILYVVCELPKIDAFMRVCLDFAGKYQPKKFDEIRDLAREWANKFTPPLPKRKAAALKFPHLADPSVYEPGMP